MIVFRLWLKFRVSGNFPETAWRVMNFHKAAHAFLACYWVREEEPPGGTFPATRRRMTSYPIPGLLDEASGGIG